MKIAGFLRRRNCSAFAKYISVSAIALALSGCADDPVALRQQEVAQDPLAMLRIADAADSLGDTEGAQAFYRRAADLQPDSVAANIGIARALAAEGHIDQAIDTLRTARERAPSDSQLIATLGRLLVAARRPADALIVFDDGLRQDARNVSLLIGRGVALDALDRHDDAQQSYRAALQRDPENAAARKDLDLSLSLGQRIPNSRNGPSSRASTSPAR